MNVIGRMLLGILILMAPLAARADLITGGAGSMVSDNGPNGGRDDTNVATTSNASYQTSLLVADLRDAEPISRR